MKNKILTKVSGTIKKTGNCLKKHSPEILLVVGIVGVATSTVMACLATRKLDEKLDPIKDDISDLHKESEEGDVDIRKDLVIAYAKEAGEVAKLYAPAVVTGVFSVTCILASNGILKKRNVAISSAYTTLYAGYEKYRSNVVERFGEKVDEELALSIKPEEVEDYVKDDKTGKNKKVKKTIDVADGEENPYRVYFTKDNPYWDETPLYNRMFLESQERYATDLLIANGSITLNEVRSMVGKEPVKAGLVVGWVYEKNNKVGDNQVKFRIKEVYLKNEDTGDYELAYALDLNPDGSIYERLTDEKQ